MKKRPVIRLLAFDHCRCLAPWCAVRAGQTPLLKIRRLAHELEQAGEKKPSFIEAGIAHVAYLFLSFRQCYLVWRAESLKVRQHYGIGRFRQFLDLLKLAWRGNLPPPAYYFQRLFRLPDKNAYLSVISHRELQVVLRALHAGADTSVLDDKMEFHAFCARLGLPTAPLVAAYAAGQPLLPSPSAEAWRTDLFSKPARSYSSRGIASWRYDQASDTHSDGKNSFARPDFESWLATQSGDNCLIVQPRLENSSDLQSISGQALANCRVVTARRPDGSITVVLAALRLGLGDAITSDEPTRSFCASINLDTGVIGPAETKQAAQGTFTHHPDSGASITGRALSHWPQMRAMALRAHAQLPQMIFVGWDVIDTNHGPMLLEGNVVWGGNLAQMAGNPPLGLTEFPAIFFDHYARRNDRSGPRRDEQSETQASAAPVDAGVPRN